MNYLLLFLLHGFVWFCFGALCGMVRGHGAMKMLSAIALGIISASAQLIASHLGYLPW